MLGSAITPGVGPVEQGQQEVETDLLAGRVDIHCGRVLCLYVTRAFVGCSSVHSFGHSFGHSFVHSHLLGGSCGGLGWVVVGYLILEAWHSLCCFLSQLVHFGVVRKLEPWRLRGLPELQAQLKPEQELLLERLVQAVGVGGVVAGLPVGVAEAETAVVGPCYQLKQAGVGRSLEGVVVQQNFEVLIAHQLLVVAQANEVAGDEHLVEGAAEDNLRIGHKGMGGKGSGVVRTAGEGNLAYGEGIARRGIHLEVASGGAEVVEHWEA